MKSIKLTVVGTITKDIITFPDGKVKKSFGGILYNILPFALLAPQDMIISPVCSLGSDIYKRVLSYLNQLENVELNGISRVS